MDYKIGIGTETKTVEIDSADTEDPSEYQAGIQGSMKAKTRITLLTRTGNRLILSLNGRVYSVILEERNSSSLSFLINGSHFVTSIGPTKTENSASLMASSNELVTSNFPAKVVKLVAKIGDALKEGDTMIVLEAMKMEAQVKAPRDCVVEQIFVKEGDMVGKGKPLMKLKFR